MSGRASPIGDDSEKDTTHPEDDKSDKAVCTVWHGYDIVLTDNGRPSESNVDCEKKDQTGYYHYPKRAVNKQHPSWRRMSSGQQDDYGWLRQLDLRSDIPSIEEIRHWNFDVLEFEDTVLIDVFIQMLEYYKLLDKFSLDRKTLERYCKEVMDRHRKDCYYQKVDIERERVKEEQKPKILCEYHNWYHVVSCAHVSFLFLTHGGADAHLYPVDIFCIIMGSLIHDLDHQGTNNDFEVKRATTLAKLYDNDSVLERHSINVGLNMCQGNPDLDWLKSFDEKDREYVKHFISEIILATDPARHGDIVKEALAFVDKGPQDYQSTSTSEVSSDYFNQNDPQHRLSIGRLILHCADISNPVNPSFEVALDWAIRVTIEFTRQANKEKKLHLPITSFMDGLDSEYKIAKLQIGFFHFMVKPLFNTVGILFTSLKMLEDWGLRNCVEYQTVIDAHDLRLEHINDADCKDQSTNSVYSEEKTGPTPF